MEICIRKLQGIDLDTVTRIYEEILTPDYISFSELHEGKAVEPGVLSADAASIFRQQLVDLLDSPSHGFFVAVLGEKIAGFALASVEKTEAGHTEAWLDDIGVSPQFGEKGIGKRMIEHVVEWAIQQEAQYILLESGIQNRAHELFTRLNFSPLALVFHRPLLRRGNSISSNNEDGYYDAK